MFRQLSRFLTLSGFIWWQPKRLPPERQADIRSILIRYFGEIAECVGSVSAFGILQEKARWCNADPRYEPPHT